MPYCLQCGATAYLRIPEGDSRERLVCDSCGYIHYQNPNIICGSLVVHEGKVLLCRRAIEPQYGLWTIPAGFMEIGETVQQGALRETLEEAEAIALRPQLYCLYDLPEIGQVYMLYLSELKDGQFGAGSESLECQLFHLDDIPWSQLSFEAVRRTLKYFIDDCQKYNSYTRFPLHQEVILKEK